MSQPHPSSDGYSHIVVTRDGAVATITMNRPERRNALSFAHIEELIDAFGAVAKSDARVVILAANGPVFCAGHDYGDMVERDLDGFRALFRRCAEMMNLVQSIPQPVVASVQGIATGAGCQLVATCDLAVASDTASFATPGGKGGWFCSTPMVAVSRAIGRKRALEMLLTGDAIDARTAADWGLVNRVVPAGELRAETEKLAHAASRGSTASKAIGKHAFYEQIDLDQTEAYAYASEVMSTSAVAPDGREAIASFFEKRKPVYR
jgi:enoyl-CoA hydratase/carnithine racemase